MSTLQDDLQNAIGSIQKDCHLLHEIVQGDDKTVVETENGEVKSLANIIASIGNISGQLLKDLSNAPNDSLGRLGFAGFSKDTKAHTTLELSSLSDINENSIYLFENKGDSPFKGKGLVHTMIADGSFAIQIVYHLDNINSSSYHSPQYYRTKINGGWGTWSNAVQSNIDIETAVKLANLLSSRGDIIYFNGTDNSRLAIGQDGYVLTVVNGVPSWEKPSNGNKVVDIPFTPYGAGRYESSGFIMDDGSLRVWGNGDNYQLGVGDTTFSEWFPVQPAFPHKITAKVVKWVGGSYENFVLFDNGEVWSWGQNAYGVLGHGHTQPVTYPQKIEALNGVKIVDISIGTFHRRSSHFALFLAEDGRGWGTGYNADGQTGNGNRVNSQSTPQKLAKTDWVKLYSVGAYGGASFGIDKSGRLYSWGWNMCGVLGLGDDNLRTTPTLINGFGGEKVVQFHGSMNATTTTTSNDYYGHCIALTESGKVYTWGYNIHGQLGTNDNKQYNTPQEIKVLWTDNVEVLTNDGYYGKSYVRKKDGRVFACGAESYGAIGQDTKTNDTWWFQEMKGSKRQGRKIIQMQALGGCNNDGFALLYDDGVILVCGYNGKGNLGVGNNTESIYTLTEVKGFMKHKPIKLCVVGDLSEACLGILTQEGYYYQAGTASPAGSDIRAIPQIIGTNGGGDFKI